MASPGKKLLGLFYFFNINYYINKISIFLFMPDFNLPKQRKFITTLSEANESLSYQNDLTINEYGNGLQAHYNKTLALGNGSSYVYPRAEFLCDGHEDTKQVYPPIIDCSLTYIQRGRDDTEILLTITGNTGFVGNIYHTFYGDPVNKHGNVDLFMNTFDIDFEVGFSGNIDHICIPSFDPTVDSDNDRWAYILGNTVYIHEKNELRGLRFPEYGTHFYEETSSNDMITFLRIGRHVDADLELKYGVSDLIGQTLDPNKNTILRRTAHDIGIVIDNEKIRDPHKYIFSAVNQDPNNSSVTILIYSEISYNYSDDGHSGQIPDNFLPIWDPNSVDNIRPGNSLIQDLDHCEVCNDIPLILTNFFIMCDDKPFTNSELSCYKNISQSGTMPKAKIKTKIHRTQIENHEIPIPTVNIDSNFYGHGKWFNTPYGTNFQTDYSTLMIDDLPGGSLYTSGSINQIIGWWTKNSSLSLANPDTELIYTPADYIANTNLFDFINTKYTPETNELTLIIEYFKPKIRTIRASEFIGGDMIMYLCANIIMPYYDKAGFLCFGKGLIYSHFGRQHIAGYAVTMPTNNGRYYYVNFYNS